MIRLHRLQAEGEIVKRRGAKIVGIVRRHADGGDRLAQIRLLRRDRPGDELPLRRIRIGGDVLGLRRA